MGTSWAKKLVMFRTGSTALRQYIHTDEYYICPLCLYGFSRAALDAGHLTVEHVPPEKLGGFGVLLTCKDCNNRSGHTLDSHMVARDRVRRFYNTVLGKESSFRGPVTVETGGERLNVEMYRNGKFLVLTDDHRRNNPAVVERMTGDRLLKARISSEVRYNQTKAAIGDLRAAYLAAFALLGYRYALHPAFNVVRQQIAEPDAKLLRAFVCHLDSGIPSTRTILELSTPHCLGVQLDKVLVLLPIPGSSDHLYEQLATQYESGGRMEFPDGDDLGWPQGLELREDFGLSRLQSPTLSWE